MNVFCRRKAENLLKMLRIWQTDCKSFEAGLNQNVIKLK